MYTKQILDEKLKIIENTNFPNYTYNYENIILASRMADYLFGKGDISRDEHYLYIKKIAAIKISIIQGLYNWSNISLKNPRNEFKDASSIVDYVFNFIFGEEIFEKIDKNILGGLQQKD